MTVDLFIVYCKQYLIVSAVDIMQTGELEREPPQEVSPPGSMTVTRDIATPQPQPLLPPTIAQDYK